MLCEKLKEKMLEQQKNKLNEIYEFYSQKENITKDENKFISKELKAKIATTSQISFNEELYKKAIEKMDKKYYEINSKIQDSIDKKFHEIESAKETEFNAYLWLEYTKDLKSCTATMELFGQKYEGKSNSPHGKKGPNAIQEVLKSCWPIQKVFYEIKEKNMEASTEELFDLTSEKLTPDFTDTSIDQIEKTFRKCDMRFIYLDGWGGKAKYKIVKN